MRRGTKIGWLLVACSLVLSVWVISGGKLKADNTDEYVIDSNGIITSYTGTSAVINIPDTVGDVTVRGIASGTFSELQRSTITSVSMPSSLTTLGDAVFSGCSSLSSISLSSSLSSIPAKTFYGCSSLESVNIPGNVTSIGSQAFYGCVSLSSVSIPGSVSSISADAFDECDNLRSIDVSGNSHYTSSDGCLYNATKTKLIRVPAGKPDKPDVAIASSTKEIGAGAFNGCQFIDVVTIPASVTSIGNQGGWTPARIYGYADSAAEAYAKDNNIDFVVVGNSGSTGEENPSDEQPVGGDEQQPAGDEGQPVGGNEGQSDSDQQTAGGDGTQTTDTGAAGTGSDSGQVAAATGTTNGTSTGTVHEKDATPKTADGFDSRYFLCIAIFLGGVGVILSGKKNKMILVQQENAKNK